MVNRSSQTVIWYQLKGKKKWIELFSDIGQQGVGEKVRKMFKKISSSFFPATYSFFWGKILDLQVKFHY